MGGNFAEELGDHRHMGDERLLLLSNLLIWSETVKADTWRVIFYKMINSQNLLSEMQVKNFFSS